ncbi:MAG TPA: branched-chain amino acid ABC transporter permease [Bacillota bacterium]|nr:branched-chain amino acid ABC transporter permease [Clostridiaceae bacterium]HNR03319.1 branched-chain amino acid ABC transporter permease [Bacillota bacterium]HNT02496.1 branched-chain amino acid ABC transporter permease [Bacillota bacterium]HPA55141.1 branched-chain amino acid ABC transporter permease [Bacillota bacterium]HPX69694.1 branched-chain amino acid ABC transporter permease [Bacillota bacterium]
MGNEYILGILTLAGINLMTVLGLSLLTGFTGLFSFGHAGFMAIGGYATALMTVKFHWPFIPALLAGGLAAALVSAALGKVTLNLKGDYFCIATLGFGEAIRLILDNVQTFGGARGWPGIPHYTNVWNVLGINIVAVIVLANLIRSRHGRNMIAVREEELASQIVGINVFNYKMTSLVTSAAYAGIAGGLMGHYMTFLQPKMFSLAKSTELTIIVIFGGLGSISGSVLGALVLTSLPEILRAFSSWRLVFYGLAVIFIMISRPEGLMGGYELTPSSMKKLFRNMAAKRENKLQRAGGGK